MANYLEEYLTSWLEENWPNSKIVRGYVEVDDRGTSIGYFAVYSPPTLDVGYTVTAVVLLKFANRDTPTVCLESNNPLQVDCPPYILEALTYTDNLTAKAWRRMCALKHWDYAIEETCTPEGEMQLSLRLGSKTARKNILLARAKTKKEYSELYETIQSQHAMANIDPIRKRKK